MVRAGLLILFPAAFAAGFYGMRLIESPAPPPAPAPVVAEAPAPPAPAAAPAGIAAPSVSAPLRAPDPEPDLVATDRPIRNVTPEGFTQGPRVTGPLRRVAPPPGPERQPPPEPARQERIHRPVFAAAGLLQTGDGRLRLAGIAAPDVGETCGSGADAWPCGRMALAALRRFVRGRAVDCPVPPGSAALPDEARCSVAGEDIGEWLVAQGWARAEGDGYRSEERAAREARRGLWSPRRPGGDQAAVLANSPDSALAISERVSGTP